MLAWGPYAHPTSSFNKPVPLPGSEPDWGPCATVSFSRAWLPYVLGAMTQLLLQTTWDTDDEDEFRLVQEQASTLIAMFAQQGWDDMSGCGCSGIPAGAISRWNEDGDLQVSYDGGTTWQDYPQGDPRLTATLFPPINPESVTSVPCAAAMNIVTNFTDQIDQYADDLESLANLAALIVDIDASVAVFLGVAGATAAFIAILAAELIPLGASAVRAAFDADVWDRFKCNLYHNSQSDGSFTTSDVAAIKARVDVDETGITAILLKQMIDTLGSHGLTNVGRSGGADGDTCSECGECEDCVDGTSHTWSYKSELPEGWTYISGGTGNWDGNPMYLSATPYLDCIIFDQELCVLEVDINANTLGTDGVIIHAGDLESPLYGSGYNAWTLTSTQKTDRICFENTTAVAGGVSLNSFTLHWCVPA